MTANAVMAENIFIVLFHALQKIASQFTVQ